MFVYDWFSYLIICWICRVEGIFSLEVYVGDVVGLWGMFIIWLKGLMYY